MLVLGQDSRSFLAVIRSLGRRGVEVHVAWHDPEGVALRSRYVVRTHALPACSGDPDEWYGALRALMERERFDLVLPTNDPSVVALESCRARFGAHDCVHLPGPRAFAVAFDKLETWNLARSLAIPLPEQRLVTCVEEGRELLAELGRPVVLKPRRSYAFGRKKWEHQVRKAYDERDLEVYLAALLEKDQVLAQRNVLGRGIGVDVLAHEGEVLLAFQHLRLHEPAFGGGSSYRKSVPLDPDLLDAARRLMRATQHTGVAMVEFKRDPKSGAWVLIEINARFWGSLPLALASGADFPWALLHMLLDGERVFPQRYRTGICCRNGWMDLAWWMQNRGLDRSDPTLSSVGLVELAGEVGNIIRLRERNDTLVLDDLRPGLVELGRTLRELVRVPANRVRKLPLSWRFVRARLARSRARALDRARRVLFVCRGNICRSPFAAAYARALLGGRVEVLSAGYYPESDRRPPREAIEIARSFGVDIDGHRSRVVDDALLEGVDLVFFHDEQDRRHLATRHPATAHKLLPLATLCAHGTPDIRDPYGGSCTDFEASYAAIARALQSAVGRAGALALPAHRPAPHLELVRSSS